MNVPNNQNQLFIAGAVATQLLTSHYVDELFRLLHPAPSAFEFYGVHVAVDTVARPLLWWMGSCSLERGQQAQKLLSGRVIHWASFSAISLLGLRGENRIYGAQICRVAIVYIAPDLLNEKYSPSLRFGIALMAQLLSTVAIGKATIWALQGSNPMAIWGALALESVLLTPLVWISISSALPGEFKGEAKRMGENMCVAGALGFAAWGGTELLGMRGFLQRFAISLATLFGPHKGENFQGLIIKTSLHLLL